MPNYKLTISYDGTHYAGWQRQTSRQPSAVSRQPKKTIQQEIESALQKIFRKKIYLIGSGRTDAGVHATSQVANFKVDKLSVDLLKLERALNGILPGDIVISKIQKVSPSFHARFCAASKIYRYVILNTQQKTPFMHQWVTWIRHPLDLGTMQRESRCLLGRHDFKSFQASDRIERKSRTTIRKIRIRRFKSRGLPFLQNHNFVIIDIEADGFLRNMVRNIAGTLIEVGKGKIHKGELQIILKKKDRRFAGPCAPAKGLYLLDVCYPPKTSASTTKASADAR